MWNEINNENDLNDFLNMLYFFHDSCIKELKYISGAYVNERLSMYPVNDIRKLYILIQRQFAENSVIELEFSELKYLKLVPADSNHTCEILDATMIIKDDCIYWCDCGGLSEADLDKYNGTVICASKVRWRSVEKCLGEDEVYNSRT